MAKEQKRSNREIRKPKATKPVSAAPVATFLNKTDATTSKPAKKK